MSEELDNAIKKLIKAIDVEGPVPQYHRHVVRKHRSEWATLWSAIDEIVAIYKSDSKR
jgi:hypothetical protein